MGIHLRVLGELDLRGPDQTELHSVLAQPKRLALLTYLAVATPRGFHRRDSLVALLWPDQDAEHARAALRQLLYGLRRSLGEGALQTRGDDVALDTSAFDCDVWSFEEAAARGDAEAAVGLHRGAFLAGFFLSEAPEFEQWVESERTRLDRTYAAMLERVAEEASPRDPAHAVACWRRLAEHDPYCSRIALRLMQALEAAGDGSAAIRHAEQHAALLRAELDAEPDPEVSALADRLRRHPASPAALVPASRATPGAETTPTQTAPERELAPGPTQARRPLRLVSAGIVAVALVAAGAWALRVHGPGLPTAKEPVVVLPFEVQGGDASLGVQAADRIAGAIEAAKLASVMAYRPKGGAEPFTERVGRRAVKETGAATLIVGTIAYRGAEVEVQARVVRASDLGTVWTLGPERGSAGGEMTPVLDSIRERVLGAIGYYLDPRSEPNEPLGLYQPSRTLEGWRLLDKAQELFASGLWAQSLPFAQEAFARDTMELYALLLAQTDIRNLGRTYEADSLTRFLEARRERMYPGNALLLDYFSAKRSSPEDEYRATMVGMEIDPNFAFNYMSASLRAGRRPLQALRLYALRDTTILKQREWQAWDNVAAQAYHMLGRFEEELALARSARARAPRYFNHWTRVVGALAVLGRTDEIEQVVTESYGLETQGAPVRLMNTAASELFVHGRGEEARGYAERTLAGLGEWPDSLRATTIAQEIRRNALALSGQYGEVVRMFDQLSRSAARGGLQYRVVAMPYRIAMGDTTGALAMVDSARGQPLEAFATWQRRDTPLYYAAQILSLMGRKDDAVATLREALNNGWRLGNDEQLQWYWAPIKDYAPFQEVVKLRDGS